MEQKKILWIVLSVVVFVVVVGGGGLLCFRPAVVPPADGSAEPRVADEAGFDAIEYIREGDAFPGIEKTPADEASDDGFVAVTGEIVYGEDPEAEAAGEEGDAETPSESGETVSADNSAPVRTPLPEVITAQSPSARPAAPVQQATTPAPASESARTPRTVVEYWIQAGSFQSTSRAEEVKSVMEDKGFAAVITTKDVSGKTWFRVRVGPYPNKGEAQKFLDWVKALDGFDESYISEVTVVR